MFNTGKENGTFLEQYLESLENPTRGRSITVACKGEEPAFAVVVEPSKSGGIIIRSIGPNGYETAHYESGGSLNGE